ncbi:Maf family protein [Cohnella algarum]|uniref:Maf family protein n=1 Tax=Cohnella algarum TaxID=2044859 RepID=UPI0019686478|nr:Maf family protein [Cohnella algarum]MBN2984852.1 septum formation protein Maf [Cohnella algarum]
MNELQSASEVTLILASASPRRQELIRLLGLPVVIRPSDTDESTPPEWTPPQVVERLSLRKAEAVAETLPPAAGEGRRIVVGSDTVVALNGEIMGKPKDLSDAVAMLRRLSGRTHEVFTGVTCLEPDCGRSATSHRVTRVRMKELSSDQIRRYAETGEPMDKAGAYGIQGIGSLLVEGIEGCYFNVVGLPVSLVADMLEPFGLRFP